MGHNFNGKDEGTRNGVDDCWRDCETLVWKRYFHGVRPSSTYGFQRWHRGRTIPWTARSNEKIRTRKYQHLILAMLKLISAVISFNVTNGKPMWTHVTITIQQPGRSHVIQSMGQTV
jgi:hypothetical protein